jgi:hypothetical protein
MSAYGAFQSLITHPTSHLDPLGPELNKRCEVRMDAGSRTQTSKSPRCPQRGLFAVRFKTRSRQTPRYRAAKGPASPLNSRQTPSRPDRSSEGRQLSSVLGDGLKGVAEIPLERSRSGTLSHASRGQGGQRATVISSTVATSLPRGALCDPTGSIGPGEPRSIPAGRP